MSEPFKFKGGAEPYVFGNSTPGQRMAARRTVCSRPGHPGYVEDQLRALCGVLAANPGVHELLGGSELEVSVGVDRKRRTLMFVLAAP